MLVSLERHFAYKTLSDPLKLTKVFPVQKTLWHCQNKCSDILKSLPKLTLDLSTEYQLSLGDHSKTKWHLQRFFPHFQNIFILYFFQHIMNSQVHFFICFLKCFLREKSEPWRRCKWEKKCYLSFFQLFLSPSFYS